MDRLRTRIMRLYKMEELLITKNGMNAKQLTLEFKVNRRTIYRDIQLIQELGIPVIKDQGLFKILGTYKVPSYRPNIVGGLCNE